MSYALLSLANFVIFTFGALTFSILAVFYWRARPGRSTVFAVFTAACAAAFVLNLLLQVAPFVSVPDRLLDLVTGVLPPLLLHVVYDEEREAARGRVPWQWILAVLYVAGLLSPAPEPVLGICGALGLVLTLLPRTAAPADHRLRVWNRALLGLTVVCAIADLALLADYLLLAFFCVTLYYKERLVFFDLLIKRGAFFLIALAGLTAFFAARGDGDRAPLFALLLAPLWLAAPWIYRRLAALIDRAWLGRRYSIPEAEQHFAAETQSALDEDELHDSAVESLGYIFRTRAEVRFEPAAAPAGAMVEKLEHRGVALGWIAVEARPDSAPFLSDDRRLFHAIAATLAVLLENVRFRRDQQELRWLASRAELKALRAQINPHFLFNALNSIAGLIEQQPRLADDTIEQLAQVFRYTLRGSGNEWVRLDEEVDFVKAYLRVEQARFGDRLRVEFDVDPAVASARIPAMSIQPLIENAVKHGGAGVVALRAARVGGLLSIEVFDCGPGFPPDFSLAASSGHGLRNVAARLHGYYGDAAALRWECTPAGTRVSLTLPAVEDFEHARANRG